MGVAALTGAGGSRVLIFRKRNSVVDFFFVFWKEIRNLSSDTKMTGNRAGFSP